MGEVQARNKIFDDFENSAYILLETSYEVEIHRSITEVWRVKVGTYSYFFTGT